MIIPVKESGLPECPQKRISNKGMKHMRMIYADNAATTPVSATARRVFL